MSCKIKEKLELIKLPKGIYLSSASMELGQEPDSCKSIDDCQDGDWSFKMSTDNAGGGNFLVIETGRWCIDGEEQIDELCTIMKEFYRRTSGEE